MMRRLTIVALLFVVCGFGWGCSNRSPSPQGVGPVPDRPPVNEGNITAPTHGGHGGYHHRGPASLGPVTDEEILDASVAKLRRGKLAYSPQQAMKMGETVPVKARIGSSSVSLDTLKAGLGPGQSVDVVDTPVSTKMKMTLTGSDFEIKALSSEEQFVDDKTPTEWSWDVQPKHPGKLGLHLAAVVEVGGLSKDYVTVDREITVAVNPVGALVGFFNGNWQKGLYATLAVMAGFVWKRVSDGKKKDGVGAGGQGVG